MRVPHAAGDDVILYRRLNVLGYGMRGIFADESCIGLIPAYVIGIVAAFWFFERLARFVTCALLM